MLQPSDPTPHWLDLLKLIVGPLIAAIVFILGLLWRDRIERRNAAQAWFEQTYLTDGLDVIIAHLAVLCHSINEGRRIMTDIKVAALPSAVSRRFFGLLPYDFLTAVETAEAVVLTSARKDYPITLTQEESKELLTFCVGLTVYADSVRKFLLDKEITAKSDVYTIEKDPKFIALIKELQENFIEENLELRTMNLSLQTKYRERIHGAARALKDSKSPNTPDAD